MTEIPDPFRMFPPLGGATTDCLPICSHYISLLPKESHFYSSSFVITN